MANTDKNLQKFSKILNVYNEINLDKMAKLIGFRNSIDLEQWILDLQEKYHTYLTIRGKNVKFARLQIAEISEECAVKDEQLIVDTVREMIDNKEIYAQYFSSTKSVAFDQQANIDEIDKLMATYKEWEEKKVEKK